MLSLCQHFNHNPLGIQKIADDFGLSFTVSQIALACVKIIQNVFRPCVTPFICTSNFLIDVSPLVAVGRIVHCGFPFNC